VTWDDPKGGSYGEEEEERRGDRKFVFFWRE